MAVATLFPPRLTVAKEFAGCRIEVGPNRHRKDRLP